MIEYNERCPGTTKTFENTTREEARKYEQWRLGRIGSESNKHYSFEVLLLSYGKD